jgi:hypothetical protein
MSETETPDHALDAAVEEAVEVVESLFRYDGRPEQRAVRDLIAAVEARAVARDRRRECAWTQRGTASWDTQCGEYIIATFRSKRCDNCGGRVRVDAPAEDVLNG